MRAFFFFTLFLNKIPVDPAIDFLFYVCSGNDLQAQVPSAFFSPHCTCSRKKKSESQVYNLIRLGGVQNQAAALHSDINGKNSCLREVFTGDLRAMCYSLVQPGHGEPRRSAVVMWPEKLNTNWNVGALILISYTRLKQDNFGFTVALMMQHF